MNKMVQLQEAKVNEIAKKSKKGFTLVELVVVIAILAILAAIAIPVISNTINSSKKSGAASDAQTLELALKEADAQIVAGDTSLYTKTSTVKDVCDKKAIKLDASVSVGSKTYNLVWTTDEKCVYLDKSSGSGTEISSGKTYTVKKAISGSTDTSTIVSFF